MLYKNHISFLRRDGEDTANIIFLTLEDATGKDINEPKLRWINDWYSKNKDCRNPCWEDLWHQNDDKIGNIGKKICKICKYIIQKKNHKIDWKEITNKIYKLNVQNIKFNPLPRINVSDEKSNTAIINFLGTNESTIFFDTKNWIDTRTNFILENYSNIFKPNKIYISCCHHWLGLLKKLYGYSYTNVFKVYTSERNSYTKFLSPKDNSFLFFYIPLLAHNINDILLEEFAKDLNEVMEDRRITFGNGF